MAGPGKPSFGLQKTWRASGTGTQTFNAAGNYSIPYGRHQITVTGRGGTGTAAVPGNPNYNPVVPGNAYYNPYVPGNPNYNPYTPGNPASYYAGFYMDVTYSPFFGGYIPSYYIPGNPSSYNPGSPGNVSGYNPSSGGNYAGTNPSSGGNYANTNPTTPAVPGNASTALGITLPGSNTGGTPAPATPATLVSYYSYPDNATYPVSVPSGGYVTITSS
jgi:hypothetical protein